MADFAYSAHREKSTSTGRRRDNEAQSFIALLGVIMAAMGIIGYARYVALSIFSPFTIIGAMCYIVVGSFLALSFSSTLRMTVLQTLPTPVLQVLFQKSLIQVVEELTHPIRPKEKRRRSRAKTHSNSLLQGYELLALAGTLDHDEIEQLSSALPIECEFMKKPGLIRFLPKPLRAILNGDGIVDDIIQLREHHRAIRIAEEEAAAAEAAQRAAAAGTTTASGFFALPDGLRGSHSHPTAPQATTESEQLDSERVKRNQDSAFEKALTRALKKHIVRYVKNGAERMTARLMTTATFVASGGPLPTTWLRIIFAISTATIFAQRIGGKLLIGSSSGESLVANYAAMVGLGTKAGIAEVYSLWAGVISTWALKLGLGTASMMVVRELRKYVHVVHAPKTSSNEVKDGNIRDAKSNPIPSSGPANAPVVGFPNIG